jgi:hypothetical protein
MLNGRTPTNILARAILPALANTSKHHLLESVLPDITLREQAT